MTQGLAKTEGISLQEMEKPALIAKIKELQNSIVNLGDGQVFLRRDKTGVIRACRGIVSLREELGEIQTIQGKTMVTAPGASKLNQTPGLNIITPLVMVVDGKEVSNPYPVKHPKTKVLQSVYVRKIVFGASPLGNMVGIDYTLYYSIYTYFIQDLQAKIKKYPVCGYIGKNIDGNPSSKCTIMGRKWITGKNNKKGYYIDDPDSSKTHNRTDGDWDFHVLDDSGLHSVGIWVDVSHKEIQACYNQLTQRQQFGDRNAQTICTRNALLRHPAIASQNVIAEGEDKKRVAKITVYGFLHEHNIKTISEMAEKIATGDVDPGKVQISQKFSEAEYSEVTAADKEENDEFSSSPEPEEEEDIPIDLSSQQTPANQSAPLPQQAPDSEERNAILSSIFEFRETNGDTWFFKKLTEFKKSKGKKSIKWSEGYSNDDLGEVLALIGKGEK